VSDEVVDDLEAVLVKVPGLYRTVHTISQNVDNHMSIIAQTHIVVNYALLDSVPLNLLESMSLGKPIITNDIGCCSEIVNNGYDGYVYHNDTQLEDILLKLITNKSEIKRLGDNAKKTFLKYSENDFDQYLKFMK
jgi:glycosyltransferase involved in cell wall biosynthesis